MGQYCVFCGGVGRKSNEHVIPKWILELGGDLRRTVRLGFNERGDIAFSANSCTVRACGTCNSRFAQLEDAASRVVKTLIREPLVIARDALVLMDWMDKIRVGFWHLQLQVTGNPLGIHPHFHVADRVGIRDHLLFISRSELPSRRMNFAFQPDLTFMMSPTYFLLVINGLALLSYSTVGCVQRLSRKVTERAISQSVNGQVVMSVREVSNDPAFERTRWPCWDARHTAIGVCRPSRLSQQAGHVAYHAPWPFELVQFREGGMNLIDHPEQTIGFPAHYKSPYQQLIGANVLAARLRLYQAQTFRRQPTVGSRSIHRSAAAQAQLLLNECLATTAPSLMADERRRAKELLQRSNVPRADVQRVIEGGLAESEWND